MYLKFLNPTLVKTAIPESDYIRVRNSGRPGLPELLLGYYKNKSTIGDSSSLVIWITDSLITSAGQVSETIQWFPLGFNNKLYLINHFKDIIGDHPRRPSHLLFWLFDWVT